MQLKSGSGFIQRGNLLTVKGSQAALDRTLENVSLVGEDTDGEVLLSLP